MKNKVHLFASLLGTTLLLTGCNIDTASLPASSLEALAKEAPVQEVAAGNTNTLKTVSNQTQASANSSVSDNTAVASQKNYIQVFIDPNTGELVTINPDTGEAVPYTAPAAAAASQTATEATVSQSTAQTGTASSQNTAKTGTTSSQNTAKTGTTSSQNTAQARTAASGTQNNQTNTTSSQTVAAPQAQAAASVDATSQATPASTQVNQAAPSTQNRATAQAANTSSYIGESRALQIALQHAGVNASDTLFSYAKLDYDDGRYEYDVEFYAGNREYDYEIDAVTGNILAYDYDMESYFTPPVQQQQAATPQQAPAQNNAAVSIETAKQTALSHVPGATANNIRIKSDYDDGRLVYEGKIIYNALEYEFEISAATGDIIEWDVESVYD